MTRLYGRAESGVRVRDSVPTALWHTTTMIAAVSADGAQAPFMFDGAIDAQIFRIYVERVLVPTLRPGDIVVLDNLSSHKDRVARAAIEAAGAQVWDLPPYSPDFNPIEMMWSKIKTLLRRLKARDPQQLTHAVAEALRAVTLNDIVGWFTACGYSLS